MRSLFRPQHLLGVLLVIVATLLALPTPAHASERADVINNVRKALVIVQIHWSGNVSLTDRDGKAHSGSIGSSGKCTGWFVTGNGYAVTAGHCVDEARAKDTLIQNFSLMLTREQGVPSTQPVENLTGSVSNLTMELVVEQVGDLPEHILTGPVPAQLIDYQPTTQGDVALLHVPMVANAPTIPVAAQTPDVGTEIMAIGFPGSIQHGEFEDSQLAPHVSDGRVSSIQNYQGTTAIGLTATLFGGMSGGPAINTLGEVVGVNSFSFDGLYFVTDTKGLRSFLYGHAIAPPTATPPSAPVPDTQSDELIDSDALNVPVAVLICLLAAFICATVFLLMWNRRLRTENAALKAQLKPETPVEETSPDEEALPDGDSPASSQ